MLINTTVNIWFLGTFKSHVHTYKLLFLVSRALCLFVYRPVKKLHSAPLNTSIMYLKYQKLKCKNAEIILSNYVIAEYCSILL